MLYNHSVIDSKWQNRTEQEGVFRAEFPSQKDPYYLLIEFPFPSGAGLHVGHPRSYTALDVIARKRRAEGYNVLYPIGWDAFGLPTENYAIKTGRKPADVTAENIATFTRQLKSLGFSFDWSREVNTTDPAYYKWTQWMFLAFFKAGLAYKKATLINWCVSCKIGLANEEVVAGACERCGGHIEKREKEQWMIAITKYADRLIDGLDSVEYLPKIAKQQIDWVGKSEGAEIDFSVKDGAENITVFTTRPDTIFGVTYVVLAPEHPLVAILTTTKQKEAVEEYLVQTAKKTDMERGDDTKEKTGVFSGAYAINPANGEEVPIWIADYVLGHYGTGAVMAVPAHDERDFAFAQAFALPVIDKPLLDFDEAIAVTKGKRTVKYKLRDWVFSRQRYWGEPIPLVHCESGCSSETGGWVAVNETDLPITLPEIEHYEPTDSGESPLASIDAWVQTTCPNCGGKAKRETDTMPNWAGSSWYFLRYIDPHNAQAFASKEALAYWMPVDWYNGGMEHTTLHLLYSRFWNMFLHDQGFVPIAEPYAKRTSHGLILAEDGSKMSKSKGNVVNPDEIVQEYGADTLRMYELFIGPFSEPAPWNTNGVLGVRRFLERVMKLPELIAETESEEVTRAVHKLLKQVSADIESMRFNTVVAAFMSTLNDVQKAGAITKSTLRLFLIILSPFAPHVANEVAEMIGETSLLETQTWPKPDESILLTSTIQLVVQVNGKWRAEITIPTESTEEEAIAQAKLQENVAKHLVQEPKKVIYVAGKLINFVV